MSNFPITQQFGNLLWGKIPNFLSIGYFLCLCLCLCREYSLPRRGQPPLILRARVRLDCFPLFAFSSFCPFCFPSFAVPSFCQPLMSMHFGVPGVPLAGWSVQSHEMFLWGVFFKVRLISLVCTQLASLFLSPFACFIKYCGFVHTNRHYGICQAGCCLNLFESFKC